eukprot:TRINITY_DN24118_c0_g1_i1.p1 TRINITY_DN24118_c0_g1~~TRINITY_DN24118_c0_g1_i1.p1  ORF type:complete len:206 (-),score=56.11 TRINITY_DN24118_c0_g1_i1:38-655(-)
MANYKDQTKLELEIKENEQLYNFFMIKKAELSKQIKNNIYQFIIIFKNIDKNAKIDEFADKLIEMKQISYNVPELNNEVQNAVNECAEYYKNTFLDKGVFSLHTYMQTFRDQKAELGGQILMQTPVFAQVNLMRLKELTSAQHSPDKILGSYKVIEENGKIVPLTNKQKKKKKKKKKKKTRIKKNKQKKKNNTTQTHNNEQQQQS